MINKLIKYSASGNELNEKKVMDIAERLNRKQLKAYIDGLKRWRQKNTIIVESAAKVSEKMKSEFESVFAGKKMVFSVRPDLIVGTRIVNNDMIYEMNLKNTLQDMQQHIKA